MKPVATLRTAFHSVDRFGKRRWTYEKLAHAAKLSRRHTWAIVTGKYRRDTPARQAVERALGLCSLPAGRASVPVRP